MSPRLSPNCPRNAFGDKTQRGSPAGAPVFPCIFARPAGLEPATSGLETHCSIQLSYGRVLSKQRRKSDTVWSTCQGTTASHRPARRATRPVPRSPSRSEFPATGFLPDGARGLAPRDQSPAAGSSPCDSMFDEAVRFLKGLIVDQSYNDERGTVTGSHLGASRAIHVQHPSDLHFRTLYLSDRLGEPVVVASAPVQICSGASGVDEFSRSSRVGAVGDNVDQSNGDTPE